MRVLFVCLSNINRSQFAEAFFRDLAPGHEATSAGLRVVHDREGRLIGEIDDRPVRCMRDLGYDLSHQRAKQITKAMVTAADRVIVLTDQVSLPDYLEASSNLTRWILPDPGERDEAYLRETITKIEDCVRGLIQSLPPSATKI